MSSALKVTIAGLEEAIKEVLVVLVGKDGKIGPETAQRLGKAAATRIAGVAAAESGAVHVERQPDQLLHTRLR